METSKDTNLQNPKPTKPFQHNLLQESLSLRDLPLNIEDKPDSTTTPEDNHDTPTELFEFLTSTSYDVSPAENIIFAGKLIPLNHQNAFFSPPEQISPRVHGRSESLSAIQGNKLISPVASDNAGLMRTSRSLNYRKLTRGTTNPRENNPPTKNTAKSETTPSSISGKNVKPRWYVIMFGMVKFPTEIELKADIKNRQIRRNIPPVKFQSPVDRKSRRSRSPSPSPSWKFLNALSCKDPTSVAATAPFWTPHA